MTMIVLGMEGQVYLVFVAQQARVLIRSKVETSSDKEFKLDIPLPRRIGAREQPDKV